MISIKINFGLDASIDNRLMDKVKKTFSKAPIFTKFSATRSTGEDSTPPSPTPPDENDE